MNHDRPTTLARLVDALNVRSAPHARPSPAEKQGVEGLRWVVFPALANPEGKRGLELLGAVFAGLQGFRLIRQVTNLGFLFDSPAGAQHQDDEHGQQSKPQGPFHRSAAGVHPTLLVALCYGCSLTPRGRAAYPPNGVSSRLLAVACGERTSH